MPERKKRDWHSAVTILRHWKRSLRPAPDPSAPRRLTPLERERATNVTLQEQLRSALAEMAQHEGSDGDRTRFDFEASSTEQISRAFADAWRERTVADRRPHQGPQGQAGGDPQADARGAAAVVTRGRAVSANVKITKTF